MIFATTQLNCRVDQTMLVLSYIKICQNVTQPALEWIIVSRKKLTPLNNGGFRSLITCYDRGIYSSD